MFAILVFRFLASAPVRGIADRIRGKIDVWGLLVYGAIYTSLMRL